MFNLFIIQLTFNALKHFKGNPNQTLYGFFVKCVMF